MRASKLRCAVILAVFPLLGDLPGQSLQPTEFFETKIRPLLVSKCQVCHGADQQMGGLNLSSAAGFWRGADSGPVVVKGDPEDSRLIKAVGYRDRIKMPPTGRLADAEIAALREWVRMGAPWPDTEVAAAPTRPSDSSYTQEEREFWSFQPVKTVAPPEVHDKGWIKNDLDRFILAKLQDKNLEPAPPADKLTLLRRATFDLTGLPPTESEIREFLEDDSPDSFARVVDRLLAAPRYGERWGRHWLDVARYADSTGADEDHRYPYAWRYRDYVIDAFNRDLPYNRFVMEQVAGDLLPADRAGEFNTRGVVATGFLALGPKLLAEVDKPKMFYDIVDEQIDVASRAFLGLTMACSRCHDHKFDPISTRDYYAMASIFASTKQLSKLGGGAGGVLSELYFAPLVPKPGAQRYEAHQKKLDDKQEEIDELISEEGNRYRDSLRPRLAEYMLAAREVYHAGAPLPEVARQQALDADVLERWVDYLKPRKERRPQLEPWYEADASSLTEVARAYQRRFAQTAIKRNEALAKWKDDAAVARASGEEPPPKPRFLDGDDRFFTEVSTEEGPFAMPEEDKECFFSEESKTRLAKLETELEELKSSSPPDPPFACAVAEGQIVQQRVFIRGNPANPGEEVPKGFPVFLAGEQQPPITAGSGRLELARWLADPQNPLTARVMVNRIWQWHFGDGILRTPSNFGKLGERPSHPGLLDHLAKRFVDSGWSIKDMHRFMMGSRTYQMSAQVRPEQWEEDRENRLWSRFSPRRLAVEEIRDTLLYLDGSLDLAMGGTLDTRKGTDKEFSNDRLSLNPDESNRRTAYLPLRRSNLPTLFTLFDFGDGATSSEGRALTNVAPQALYMMNSEFVAGRASSLALSLFGDQTTSDQGRVERAYLVTLNRKPQSDELEAALSYFDSFHQKFPESIARREAWQSLCQILIASNDFIYVH